MYYEAKLQAMRFHKRMQRSPWTYCIMVTTFAFLVWFLLLGRSRSTFGIPTGIDLSKFEPFEPVATTDFLDVTLGSPKIEKNIHWIWRDDSIPSGYANNLKSFEKHNPDWNFYLWTDTTSRNVIKKSLPKMLKLWDDHVLFKHLSLRRYEMIRYIVLYLYGGVVVDLSAKNYRPLQSAITNYSCILPPNPYEEAIFTGVPYTVTNRVMLCRKGHPFFKLVIENIHRHQHMSTLYDAAGEGFLMTHYQLYNTLQRERDDRNIYIQRNRNDIKDTSPYFFQGEISKSHPDAVYVPNSVYFTGSSDPKQRSTYIKTCSSFFEAYFLHQRACVHLHRRGLDRKPGKYTYIDLHNYDYGLFPYLTSNIKTVLPNIILFGTEM